MGLALNVGGDVTADVGARSSAQSWQITAEVFESRRRPPETQRVCVVAQLLTRIKIVGFEKCLGAFELLVCVVILVVEVCDFFIEGFDCCSCFVRSRLRDKRDWSNVALCVVTQINARNQTRIDEVTLKSRSLLTQDERKHVGSVSCWIIFADRRTMPTDVDDHVLHRLLNHYTFALWQRWMLHEREFNKRIFLALGPVAIKLLRHFHHVSRVYVTRQHEC